MSNRPELNLDKKKIKNMEYTFIKEIYFLKVIYPYSYLLKICLSEVLQRKI